MKSILSIFLVLTVVATSFAAVSVDEQEDPKIHGDTGRKIFGEETGTTQTSITDRPDLVALWLFEEGLTDSSSNSNTLVAVDSAATYDTSTQIDGTASLEVDTAVDNAVYITDANLSSDFPGKGGTTNTTFTICVKDRPDRINIDEYVFGKFHTVDNARSFGLRHAGDGSTEFLIGINSGASSHRYIHGSAISANTVYGHCFSYNGDTLAYRYRLWDYTTGQAAGVDSAGTAYAAMSPDTADFVVGARHHTGTSVSTEYDGTIDTLAVFNSVLTVEEMDMFFQDTWGGVADTDAPEVYGTPTIGDDGETVSVQFTETVVTTGYDDGDFDLDCTTCDPVVNDIALNDISGAGTQRTFTMATPAVGDETYNLDYTGGSDEIEDAAGNDLESFSNTAVQNNTTITPGEDTVYYATSTGAGENINKTGTWVVQPTSIGNAMSIEQLSNVVNCSATEDKWKIDPGDKIYVSSTGKPITIVCGGTSLTKMVEYNGLNTGADCDWIGNEGVCSGAAALSSTVTVAPGVDYVTWKNFSHPTGLGRVLIFPNKSAGSGYEIDGWNITHNQFRKATWTNVYMPLVNDFLIQYNYVDAVYATGSNFTFMGGKRNIFADNRIKGGKTGVIFRPSRDVNDGGNSAVFEKYVIVNNKVTHCSEEGISFDTIGNSATQVGSFEWDTVSAIDGAVITLSSTNWGSSSQDYTGYYVAVVISDDADAGGRIYKITDHDSAAFTLERSPVDLTVGDTIIIGIPFINNYIGNNDSQHIQGYGMFYNNLIENNICTLSTAGAINIKHLNGLIRSRVNDILNVTGECGRAPTGYNLIKDNYAIATLTAFLSPQDVCTTPANGVYTVYGNTFLDNETEGTLRFEYQNGYLNGNTYGTLDTTPSGSSASGYGYDYPYIVGVPTIATDGTTVSITWSESVVTTGYETGDLFLTIEDDYRTKINLSSPTGSGDTRTFTAASTIETDEDVGLWFLPAADDSIVDADSWPMATVGDKVVTNNSTQ